MEGKGKGANVVSESQSGLNEYLRPYFFVALDIVLSILGA